MINFREQLNYDLTTKTLNLMSFSLQRVIYIITTTMCNISDVEAAELKIWAERLLKQDIKDYQIGNKFADGTLMVKLIETANAGTTMKLTPLLFTHALVKRT